MNRRKDENHDGSVEKSGQRCRRGVCNVPSNQRLAGHTRVWVFERINQSPPPPSPRLGQLRFSYPSPSLPSSSLINDGSLMYLSPSLNKPGTPRRQRNVSSLFISSFDKYRQLSLKSARPGRERPRLGLRTTGRDGKREKDGRKRGGMGTVHEKRKRCSRSGFTLDS